MKKYRNKYRIPTARASFWDYGWNAMYFVTICCKNHFPFFGDIQDGKLIHSEIGRIAVQCWLEIPQHFPFVRLDAFVIMPNHIHGIIAIDKPAPVETQDFASPPPQDFASPPRKILRLTRTPRPNPQSQQ